MKQPVDEDLLRRVQRGEHSAFLVLFDRYFPIIERYAARLVQDAESVADLADMTFHQAFRHARRSRGALPRYPAYLFLICRRRAYRSAICHAVPRPSYFRPLRDDCGGAPILEELPLDIILSARRDAVFQSALNGLSLEDREIVHLAFEPDLSREDISAILKQPDANAITERLARAFRRLGDAVLREGRLAPDLQRKVRDRVEQRVRA